MISNFHANWMEFLFVFQPFPSNQTCANESFSIYPKQRLSQHSQVICAHNRYSTIIVTSHLHPSIHSYVSRYIYTTITLQVPREHNTEIEVHTQIFYPKQISKSQDLSLDYGETLQWQIDPNIRVKGYKRPSCVDRLSKMSATYKAGRTGSRVVLLFETGRESRCVKPTQ